MPLRPSSILLLLLFAVSEKTLGQGSKDSTGATITDSLSTDPLSPVMVRAFELNRRQKDVAASVILLNRRELERFGPQGLLTAFNQQPGVRMEERAPGSYRFNLRGSSLRAPFGVRNVKVYLDDLPFTDPGGTTYFNSLGPYIFRHAEVIKGPGSSLYGAGNGGVLLVQTGDAAGKGTEVELNGGSYGSKGLYAALTGGGEGWSTRAAYHHQSYDGYRAQSALKRDLLTWSGRFRVGMGQLTTTALFSDLYYETPGGLTRAERDRDPRGARPAGGGFPSAENASASIGQRTFLAGVTHSQPVASWLTLRNGIYAAYNGLRNPAIRNYGENREPHFGGRTVASINPADIPGWSTTLGFEWQAGDASFSVSDNRMGNPDTLRALDEVDNRLRSLFAQTSYELSNFIFTAGASINRQDFRFQRRYPRLSGYQEREFDNEWAPRLALLYRTNLFSYYLSWSKGFSPPATNELVPTGSNVNLDLQPERGTNWEAGIKGGRQRWSFEASVFRFLLSNSIVQRRDAGGGELFLNAGATRQEGIEAAARYRLGGGRHSATLFSNHTLYRFRYREFRTAGGDFSGNRLPGIPSYTGVAGGDYRHTKGWEAHTTWVYTAKIPLQDANTDYGPAAHLLSASVGFDGRGRGTLGWRILAGGENLLGAENSLGYDLNAFGGRFYNPAAGRTYFLTLFLRYNGKG